MEDIT